jgi:hypothetical protein
VIKHIITIAYVLFVAVATLCRPEFLAHNSFLSQFITHELLSLLAVIMTITFASVANMHFIVSRLVASAPPERQQAVTNAADGMREELDSNAWLLFWAFVAAIAFLIVKGAMGSNLFILSAMHGLGLGALLVNVLVFHDIYSTMFKLAAAPGTLPPPDA